MNIIPRLTLLAISALSVAGCALSRPANVPTCDPTGRCTYRVVATYPHDPGAFTEGLVYADGFLYESTGLRGDSSLRKVEVETGQVVRELRLDDAYFGEGIALVGDRIVQLTFTSGTGFVYRAEDFDMLSEFEYAGEGWGITYDGARLIMSDGTATLRFLDPRNLAELARIEVTDDGSPVDQLNELEYVSGEVFANVWQTDQIARISPFTGEVAGWIDLDGLLGPDRFEPGVDVLNGIAYDPDRGRLFVTGKRWPRLFQIELVPQPSRQESDH